MSASLPGVVALTGLATPIGNALTRRLVERPGLRVVGLDLRRPYRLDGRVRFHAVDLTDPTADSALAELLRSERVEVLVHTAFRTQSSADLELDHELETIGSLHVMHACAAAKISRLVLASSTMLYGPRPDNPNFLSERHPLRGHPQAHSIANRVEVEQLIASWRERHPDTEVSVLRPCWMLGPNACGPDRELLLASDRAGRDGLRPAAPARARGGRALRVRSGRARESIRECSTSWATACCPLSTLLRSAGRGLLPLPSPLLYRLLDLPSRAGSGDPPGRVLRLSPLPLGRRRELRLGRLRRAALHHGRGVDVLRVATAAAALPVTARERVGADFERRVEALARSPKTRTATPSTSSRGARRAAPRDPRALPVARIREPLPARGRGLAAALWDTLRAHVSPRSA